MVSDQVIVRIEQLVDSRFTTEVLDYIRFRYCRSCDHIKPPRSHHCSICDKCVMRMDHHCPWVGNCVGVNTHKFFWNFLFYSFFGTAHAAICLISSRSFLDFQSDIAYMMASILSLAFSLSIGALFTIHTCMLLHNMTTLEMAALIRRNPFH